MLTAALPGNKLPISLAFTRRGPHRKHSFPSIFEACPFLHSFSLATSYNIRPIVALSVSVIIIWGSVVPKVDLDRLVLKIISSVVLLGIETWLYLVTLRTEKTSLFCPFLNGWCAGKRNCFAYNPDGKTLETELLCSRGKPHRCNVHLTDTDGYKWKAWVVKCYWYDWPATVPGIYCRVLGGNETNNLLRVLYLITIYLDFNSYNQIYSLH
jgi:hypothetical protein